MRQYVSCLLTSRKLMFRLTGSSYIIFSLSFWYPLKLVGLIKRCLRETFSRVRVGKHLSDMLPIKNCLKQGDTLSPLLFNFASEYAIRRVLVKPGWHEIKWYISASGLR